MKTRLIIGLFLGAAFVQIAAPLSMILRRESVLRDGKQFKFKTAPVDPYDAFRGRYVALRIEEDNIPAPKELRLTYGQTVYAAMDTDEQGFAKFTSVAISRPGGKPYIKAKVRYVSRGRVYVDLPLDRYYMEEKAAPEAERIYRQHSSRDKQDAYILVRIKGGFAVIEGLYVGGRKIEDLVKSKSTP